MAKGRKIRGTYGTDVRRFKKKGSERKQNRNKLLQKYCDKPKNLSRLVQTVIVILAVIEIIRSIIPESTPFYVKWMVLLTLLKYIINIFDTNVSDLIRKNLKMGNSLSSVTNLAGVHGNSVAIAIGTSIGVMLCVAGFMFYQLRRLQKKVNRLMLAMPETQFYSKSTKINHQLPYLNMSYLNTTGQQNNQQTGNQRCAGGVSDA